MSRFTLPSEKDSHMTCDGKLWYGPEKRKEQLETHVRTTQRSRFGFTSYAENEKKNRVNRHFDIVAPRYDLMNTLLSMGMHHLWKHSAVAAMELKPGDKLIDICGGTGDLSFLSAKKIDPGGQAIILDINSSMIEKGLQKKGNISASNVMFVKGDAETIAFPDNSFNAAVVGFGIRNLTHMELGFREMFRVLKNGGRFCCLEFSRPESRWFRSLYDFYSFKVMPALGELITGDRDAYTVFPESIRAFSLPHEMTEILEEIGFSNVTHKSLTGGIASLHTAEKI